MDKGNKGNVCGNDYFLKIVCMLCILWGVCLLVYLYSGQTGMKTWTKQYHKETAKLVQAEEIIK